MLVERVKGSLSSFPWYQTVYSLHLQSSFVLSYAEGTEQRLLCVLTPSSYVQEGVGEYSNEAHNFQYLSWYIDQM